MRCRISKTNPLGGGIYQYIQNLKFLDRVAFCSRTILLTLTTLIFFPPALGLMDTTAAPTPSTTSLTLATSDVSLVMSSYGTDGSFVASDPATISIATNNYTGYTLGLRASSIGENATKLVNENNNTLDSISSASDPADFNVGNWGYLPSKINGTANTQYQPAPTNAGVTLDSTTTANSTANDYTITLGTKADYTTDPGTYENTFIITATANPVTYSITYDKNTTDTVTNLPETQAGNVESADITISNLTPARTNYTFISWCSGTVTTTNGVDSCSTTTYAPGVTYNTSQITSNNLALKAMWKRTFTITFNANGGSGTMAAQTIYGNSATLNSNGFSRTNYVFTGWNTASGGGGTSYSNGGTYTVPSTGSSATLYAQWVYIGPAGSFIRSFYNAGKSKATVSGTQYYKLQDMTSSICSNISNGQTGQLVDTRDNRVYNVAKLADSKCWFIDNMALNLTNSTVKANLSTSNTNASSTALYYLKSGGGSGQWARVGVSTASTAMSFTNPEIYTGLINSVPSDSLSQSGGWKAGIYYNYCAASAGSYCYGDGAGTGNAAYDICPYGWRLPTGGSSGELWNLWSKYGNPTTFRNTFRLPLSGGIYQGAISGWGSFTDVMSSTYNTNIRMHSIEFNTSNVSTSGSQEYVTRYIGWTVRCIAK